MTDINNSMKASSAKYHSEMEVRLDYYRNNTTDKDAKLDKSALVRLEYYKRYADDKDAKIDDNLFIRLDYYQHHPEDKSGKSSNNCLIRQIYYQQNKEDKDAKNDISEIVRTFYYKNHIFDWGGIGVNEVDIILGEDSINDICLKNKALVEKIINRKVNHARELTEKERLLVEIQKDTIKNSKKNHNF